MRNVKLVVAGVCVALLMVVPASAQDHSIVKGALEIGGLVGFDRQSYKHKDADEAHLKLTEFTIMPRVGKFFSDNIEIELAPILQISKASTPSLVAAAQEDQSVTLTQMGAIARGSWHFVGQGKMIPYVAVGFGVLSNSISYSGDAEDPDLETSMLLPEVAGGVKAFLSERVAIQAEAFFDMWTNADGAKDVTNTEFGIRVGVTAFHIM